MIRCVVGVGLVGAVILTAGCNAGPIVDGQAGADRPQQSMAGPIPPVEKPRDAAVMSRRTCELLTQGQAAGFGLDRPPLPARGLFGTVDCVWKNSSNDRRVQIGLLIGNPTLEVLYKKRSGFPYFDLTTVDGYPIVVTRSNPDLPICVIDAKPAERQSVTVTYESDDLQNDPQRSCDVAKRVASAVLTNLPPKG
jgi:Protein of unknown function (DUF3558)